MNCVTCRTGCRFRDEGSLDGAIPSVDFDEKVASGSGMQNFIRIMAMAVGASLTSTYWEDATKEHRANPVSIIDSTTTLTPPSGLSADSGLAVFSKMVDA